METAQKNISKPIVTELVLPLVVVICGVVLAFVLEALSKYTLPKCFKDARTLKCRVAKPVELLTPEILGSAQVKINEEPTKKLYLYKAEIWNSGKMPLEHHTARVTFKSDNKDFRILYKWHETEPRREFKEVKILEEGTFENETFIRYYYELLNWKNKVVMAFLTNEKAEIKIDSINVGTNFDVLEKKGRFLKYVLVFIIILLGALWGSMRIWYKRTTDEEMKEGKVEISRVREIIKQLRHSSEENMNDLSG